MKKLFTTDPHGAQTLSEMTAENDPQGKTGNKLFQLQADQQGAFCACMTGEELDSLAHQWLKHRFEQTFGHYTDDGGEAWQRRLATDMNIVLRSGETYFPRNSQAMTKLCELLDRIAEFEIIKYVEKT